MAERHDSMSSLFIFELTIHRISLGVDRPIDIDLLWIAGSQRSQTGERITILPNAVSHKVNQKLIIHHNFIEGRTTPCKSTLQVLEYQRYVQPTILGTCEIDLASLIFEKHTSAVTIPLDTKLDDNAFISFSVKVTNLVLGSDTVVSPSMSSVSERLGGYEDLIPATSIGTSTNAQVLHGMTNDAIYRKINKMATKLCHIEREIQAKTMKLSRINRNNLDEINGIRSRLENQIFQKDKQIHILSVQLDEMHTALALSHQRELELGGYNLSTMQLHNDTHQLDNQEIAQEVASDLDFDRLKPQTKTSNGRAYITPSFSLEKAGTAFDNRTTTNDHEFYHHHRTTSSVAANFVPGPLDLPRGSGCLVHRKLPTSSAAVKDRLMNGGSVSSSKYVSKTGSSKPLLPLKEMLQPEFPGLRPSKGRTSSQKVRPRPRNSPLTVTNKHHHVFPTTGPGNIISVGEYPFVVSGDAARRLNSPRRGAVLHNSPRQLPHEVPHALRTLKTPSGNQLRTPGTTMLNTGASPQLAERARKTQVHATLTSGSNVLMSGTNAFGGDVDIAAGGNRRLSKLPSSRYSTYENDAEHRIVSLERDLITTKVALADSETQRDIDITRLLNQTTKQ